ncbi:NUDIX domain-containing protein [Nocardia sp. NBC_00511]|uniref:NUDIX domain-containing protein n=1 Tax=Nocardia sp. NBC_00511 TaxID=2903591 RepID=UPI0030E141DC
MDSERAEYVAALPRKRMGAGALFVDELDRVLLVEPTYKDYWELPGGVVEANESPLAAAVREIDEELGLTVTLGRLLAVDWVPPGILARRVMAARRARSERASVYLEDGFAAE